jgi:hypothetical protein
MDQADWLCIAYAFPPINRSGTFRTLAFVRDLAAWGWNATVVTSEADDEPIDESLRKRIPETTAVIRVPFSDPIRRVKRVWAALRRVAADATPLRYDSCKWTDEPEERISGLTAWWSQWLVTPDSRIGWIPGVVRAGMRAIQRRRPRIIYSTSPYVSAHLAAMILSRWYHVPWVADFRDPWRENPFRDRHSNAVEVWDSVLEWCVLRSAHHVVCATPTMTRQVCVRRPFVAAKISTVLNGFDDDLSDRDVVTHVHEPDRFVLTHAGQFYGPRSPVIWFSALRWALRRSPELFAKFRMALIGPPTFDGRQLTEIARDAGVGGHVSVFGQKTHGETLSYLADSDAVMVAGSTGAGCDLQVPNKLFEYLGLRRPIIATCAATSPIVGVLRDADAKALVCHANDEVGLTDALVKLVRQGGEALPGDWSGVGKFARKHRSQELLRVFERSSRRGCVGNGSAAGMAVPTVSVPHSGEATLLQIRSHRPRRAAERVVPVTAVP